MMRRFRRHFLLLLDIADSRHAAFRFHERCFAIYADFFYAIILIISLIAALLFAAAARHAFSPLLFADRCRLIFFFF